MDINLLNPLFQGIYVNKNAQRTDPKFVYPLHTVEFYEFDLISSSFGRITVNDEAYSLRENDLFLRKPGQRAAGYMPYRFRFLTFAVEGDQACREFLDRLPDKINIGSNSGIPALLDQILALSLNDSPANTLLIKSHILAILHEYIVRCQRQQYNKHIKAAIGYIDACYAENITVEALCRELNICETYLFRLFKRDIGKSPIEYLNDVRIEKSKVMLLDTNASISDVATGCGFASVSYFSYFFKKKTDLTPSEFRKIFSIHF